MAANRRPSGRSTEGALLDDVNRRLLAELQANARLSLAELGRRVGLSSPAVAERLHRLEQADVITGYHARLNPRALGFALTAVIRIRPAPRQLHQVAELARARPEVVDCRRITGEDCYVMTAHTRSVEHLEELIDEFAAYGQTTTSIVQSSPVPPRGLDLSAVPSSGLDLSAVPPSGLDLSAVPPSGLDLSAVPPPGLDPSAAPTTQKGPGR